MDKRIWAVIIAIIILLLLWLWFYQPITIVESGWTEVGNPIQPIKKIHESAAEVDAVLWDNCCEGDVKVYFEYEWEFYDDDWTPPNDRCDDPVVWSVRDSIGKEVFSSESRSPVSTFGDPYEITDGVWDCIRPWRVTILNGCLFPINYNWEMTMWCYE